MHLFIKVIQVCTAIIATHSKDRKTFHDSLEGQRNRVFLRVLYTNEHSLSSVEEFRVIEHEACCVRDLADISLERFDRL